jgi:mannose-6-phosphate isomerase-like protein (cupin superfamily)
MNKGYFKIIAINVLLCCTLAHGRPMKILKQSTAHIKHNNSACMILEYPFDDKDINMAIAKLTGRYPETGWALNEQCKEVGYIISGNGTITFKEETIKLSEGDIIIVDANEKYFWDGTMTIVLASTPAWYPEQHKQSEI